MRILLATEAFYPAVDGTTTTLKATADRLIDLGHQVAIVAPAPGLGDYRRAPITRISPLGKLGAQVRGAIESFRPDVVHVTSPALTPAGVGRRALKQARALGVPTLVVQQSAVPELAWDMWRSRIAERADAVLVTADWVGARMAALGQPTTVWTPGVDARAFTPALRDAWLHDHWARARSASGPRVVVGYVGSLHRRHGVRSLAALADLPSVRPVIVGDGPQRGWLADRLPKAKLTGTLSTGDLAVAVASLDVLVHPGTQETCCHALREASASGVPVIAPRSGGARSWVRQNETGLLYDHREDAGLAAAVAAVAADSRRDLLGAAGREHALGRGWDVAVDELIGHLEALAPGAGARVTTTAAH